MIVGTDNRTAKVAKREIDVITQLQAFGSPNIIELVCADVKVEWFQPPSRGRALSLVAAARGPNEAGAPTFSLESTAPTSLR